MTRKNIFTFIVLLSIFPIIFVSTKINKNIKLESYFRYDYVNGTILEVLESKLEPHDMYPSRLIGRQEIRVRIDEGELEGQEFRIQNAVNAERNIIAREGMKAIFTMREKNGDYDVWLYSYKTDNLIGILTLIFVLGVVYLGKKQGVQSLISLIYTGIVLFFVLIPLIFRGYDPIFWAVLICSYIIIVSFLLIGDYDKKTTSAIIGTIFGVALAGFLAFIFGKLGKLSAIYQDYGNQILYFTADYNIKVNGLIFVSILIASMGAIMDVAMSIASAAHELKDAKESKEELFKSCINIGRDIMGTMVNTLILAFVGSSLNLILMAWGFRMTFTQLVNMPALSIEIMQALAGSIGIVFTVPFTAFVSVYVIENIFNNTEGRNE